MTRYRIHRTTRRVREELQPAGLVLGHGVHVATVSGGQAYRGTVVALGPAHARIELERARWSDAFQVGDRVRALHTGRHAIEATVVEAGRGLLHLALA